MEEFSFLAAEDSKPLLSGLSIGYLHFSGAKNQKSTQMLDEIFQKAALVTKSKFQSPEKILEDPAIRACRSLYQKIGLDPTKDRPSGEALIRRAASGGNLYRINAIVDINNIVSLKSGLPCGVYDAGKIEGNEITVKIGKAGETFEGIGGRPLDAENKILTCDSKSIFGGPTADSGRTCVTISSSEVLMLIYSPAGSPLSNLEFAMNEAEKLMLEITGAKKEYAGIFGI